MSRTIVIVAVSILLGIAVVSATLLTALHDDPTAVIDLIASSILPTAAALFAYNEASQAKSNTNGILHKAAKGDLVVVKNANNLPIEEDAPKDEASA